MTGPIINEYPPMIPQELLDRAAKLSPALLCDGMIGSGIPREGAMDAEILPVHAGMKVLGTACTVETGGGDNLPIHLALYTTPPGYVMVIDGKAHREHPYFGDLMMSTGKAVGLKGMIVDGLVRDREGCAALGFPVFARGFLQRGPLKQNPGAVNLPIWCGGVPVSPGDLVMGDADGVSVIPRARIEEILDKAEKKLAYELERRERIAAYEKARLSGGALFDLSPGWVREMLDK